MQLIKKGDQMIGSTVERNDSVYLKVPIVIDSINKNKYEMIQYNKIKGLISFNQQYFNESCYFIYSLDSFITLKSLMKKGGLNTHQLIEIFSQINEIIFSLKEYFLLESKDILLNIDNIYYDYYEKQIQLIYIPMDNNESLKDKYKEFIRSLIDGVGLEKKHSSLMNALQLFINKDKFSVKALDQLIKKEVTGKEGKIIHEKINSDNIIFDQKNSLANPIEKDQAKPKKKTVKHKKYVDALRGVALEAIALLTMNLIIKYFQITNKVHQLGIILSVQAVILSVIYLIVLKDYYGFQQLKASILGKSDYERKTVSEDNIFDPKNAIASKISEKQISYNTSTVITGAPNNNYDSKAYLLKQDFNSEEKIYITEKNFILGRQLDATDYCIEDSKISKMHVEILDIDEEIFIRDLNSTNGTYLNDEKLHPNRLTKIFDGDLVTLATLVYEFKIE